MSTMPRIDGRGHHGLGYEAAEVKPEALLSWMSAIDHGKGVGEFRPRCDDAEQAYRTDFLQLTVVLGRCNAGKAGYHVEETDRL